MLELLKTRRSVRAYKEDKVEQEKVEKLIKSALISPTSMNKKEVEIIVVEDKETILKLEQCKKMGTMGLLTAPLAMVVIGNKEKSDAWIEDAAITSIILQMEAEDLGLGSCWIQMRGRQSETGDSEEEIRELLNIPSNYGVLSVLSIGYKNEVKEAYEDPCIKEARVHYNKYI